MIRLALIIVVSTCIALAAFSAASQETDQIPEIRTFDLPVIEQLGRAIYEQDRQAAAASRLVRQHVADLRGAGLVGWIVVPEGSGHRVRFVRDLGEGPEAAFDVDFVGDTQPSLASPEDRTLSPVERAMFRARVLASRSLEDRCAGYNVVVLPDPLNEDWLVWMLAVPPSSNIFQLGGHHRFTVSADGRTVGRADALSRTCAAFPIETSESGRPDSLLATHPVSATPTEVHVFLSLLHRLPIQVTTPDGALWAVEGSSIRVIHGPREQAPAEADSD